MTLAMRFHANICSIGLKVPIIGLVNYLQIASLYEELGMPEYTLRVDKKGFGEMLEKLININIGNQTVKKNINDKSEILRKQYQEYMQVIAAFLKEQFSETNGGRY